VSELVQEEFQQNWYAILSCSKSSTKEDIERSARKLFLRYHPDKTNDLDAPDKFLLIQKAKEILLDATKRKLIDDKNDSILKRQEYERKKNSTMDERRKQFRDKFEDRLSKAAQKKPSVDDVLNAELSKRSNIIEQLRKQSSNLMEKTAENNVRNSQNKKYEFFNHRKTMASEKQTENCQIKVKWRRSAESHSDETLYQIEFTNVKLSDYTQLKKKDDTKI
jgi:DnaJ-class molecular chaperone